MCKMHIVKRLIRISNCIKMKNKDIKRKNEKIKEILKVNR